MTETHKISERRRYTRLKSVFPVEFRILDPDTNHPVTDFEQGFTADVSNGGILLRVNKIRPELLEILRSGKARVLLNIDIPLGTKHPVEAIAKVAWVSSSREGVRDLCTMGLSFEMIDVRDRRRLVGYTTSFYRMPRFMTVALLLLVFALAMNRQDQINLMRENALLVDRLGELIKKRSVVVELLNKVDTDKNMLTSRLERQSEEITRVEKERSMLLKKEEELRATIKDAASLKQELDKGRNVQALLESQLEKLSLDRKKLRDEIVKVKSREEARLKELGEIEAARRSLEKATLGNMYNWLKVHQNRRTGLIASYEGDSQLKDTAFTYDQALVAQVFLISEDMKRAEIILDFFKNKAAKQSGGFVNAYGVNNGAVSEPIVHCGPNIWIGLSFMQHMATSGSDKYLGLAKEIADWTIDIQNEDAGGGIKGGPEMTWFSTEHNLDAYAFFTMIAKETGMQKYKDAAEKSLKWLKDNAYTGQEGRIYRGKGDSTIATDTFSWAIAAIGPKGLLDNKMDPDAIMKFAEENCMVTVDFERPDGKIVEITGFDFAKHKNIGRGGVVSSEWTAQMIVSFKMMGDFYLKMGDRKKADLYNDKHSFYLHELEKMIISSPSPTGQGAGCFPYATQDNVDTGHGWRTPRGRDTGSVSGTAYGIFAIKGYNPLQLK